MARILSLLDGHSVAQFQHPVGQAEELRVSWVATRAVTPSRAPRDPARRRSTGGADSATARPAGRLPLPAEYRAALGMADRVLPGPVEDHLQVWPDESGDRTG
ncbi:hypothetical protein ACWD0Z_00770 [Streptomyces sp. NPDC003007]